MAGTTVGQGKACEVAERSPAVISANLKEDMLLQKQLVVLNRSERSIVHQIKVDQKVMYKRFQARLIRSKLANARLMGQRELQRELRAKNLGGLNTDIAGNSDEDYLFLAKLEQRLCIADGHSVRLEDPIKKEHANTAVVIDNLKAVTASSSLSGGKAISATARLFNKNKTGDENNNLKIKHSTGVKCSTKLSAMVRPTTVLGLRLDEEFTRHHAFQSDKSKEREKQNDRITNTDVCRAQIVTGNAKNDDEVSESDSSKKDKRQSVAFLESLNLADVKQISDANIDQSENSLQLSQKHISRRSSRAADFFHEDKKINLISLRLKRAKSVDFANEIRKFCDEIDRMKCTRNGSGVDYYTLGLKTLSQQCLTKSLIEVPGTPVEEHNRCIGNVSVRSLTIPKLKWNF